MWHELRVTFNMGKHNLVYVKLDVEYGPTDNNKNILG